MLSVESFSLLVAGGAILCYFMRLYFPLPPPNAVGIDLGTTFTSVAAFNNGFGNVTIVNDGFGGHLVRSLVTFYKNGTIEVGRSPSRDDEPFVTFYDSKRFLGRHNLSTADLPLYPFELKLINGSPHYVLPSTFINTRFIGNLLKPYQISSLVVEHVKAMFKTHFGYNPTKAVFGVPVEFDEVQRRETILAANLAGIEVLRLVNEPTAASMACDVHLRPQIENVVVLDLGGGTFDVAVLISIGNSLNTRSIAGNDRLGGRDFTLRLAQCIMDATDNVTDFVGSEFSAFTDMVEQIKIDLSYHTSSDLSFSKNGKRWDMVVSRKNFVDCNRELFDKLLIPISLALKDGDLAPSDVHEIVLVGGATKMPEFQRIITHYFNRRPNTAVDPDLAVVIGLTNQAGIMMQGWPLEKSAIDIPPKKLKKIIVV